MIRIKSSGNYVTFENKELAFISGTWILWSVHPHMKVCAGGEQNMSLVPSFPFLIPYCFPENHKNYFSLLFLFTRDIK